MNRKTGNNKKTIRLLVVVKSIDGGTGTFALTLLNLNKLFPKKTFEIKIAVLEKPSYRDVVPRKEIIYFRNSHFYPTRYSFSPFNFFFLFQETAFLRKTIKTSKAAIVIGIDMRCNILAAMAKFTTPGIKTIATTHIDLAGLTINKSGVFAKLFFKAVIKYFYETFDVQIAVSKKLARNLKKDFNIGKEVLVVYNGLRLKKGTKRKLKNKGTLTIITVARLFDQKDHKTLISAYQTVSKSLPSTRLWITSDGPEKENLKKFVKKMKLSKKVTFLGWVKNINSFLEKSDVFVLSSKSEGFGLAIIEAMSKGLPVISTNTPYGPSEVLDNGKYGILTPVGNVKKMSENILNILTSPKLYKAYSQKSLTRSQYFTEEKMLRSYKNVIIRLAK